MNLRTKRKSQSICHCSHLLNYLIWTIKNGGQVSSNVEKPRKSVDMAEVSNTHSLQQQMKPHIGFDLPDISFDLGPAKDCGVTHVTRRYSLPAWAREVLGT